MGGGKVLLGTGLGLALVAGTLVSAWWAAPAPPQPGRRLNWAELMPPGWTPVQGGSDVALLRDDSTAGRERWAALERELDGAPLQARLDGARIRLAGYVVPLEGNGQGLTEFLLVPYYGACIHSPPPPANQVVRVRPRRPLPRMGSFAVVEVAGRMRVGRQRGSLATSGYGMEDAETREIDAADLDSRPTSNRPSNLPSNLTSNAGSVWPLPRTGDAP